MNSYFINFKAWEIIFAVLHLLFPFILAHFLVKESYSLTLFGTLFLIMALNLAFAALAPKRTIEDIKFDLLMDKPRKPEVHFHILVIHLIAVVILIFNYISGTL